MLHDLRAKDRIDRSVSERESRRIAAKIGTIPAIAAFRRVFDTKMLIYKRSKCAFVRLYPATYVQHDPVGTSGVFVNRFIEPYPRPIGGVKRRASQPFVRPGYIS
jgi:hypothetical protein